MVAFQGKTSISPACWGAVPARRWAAASGWRAQVGAAGVLEGEKGQVVSPRQRGDEGGH